MSDAESKPQDIVLKNNSADYVASAAKSALGAVPFAGSLLSEIAGNIIPNQRIDRIVADSGASRPPIPFHSGHRFRLKSAGNSGPIRPPE